MNDFQIHHMVNRFLSWPLPDSFNPDGGVSFQRFGNEGTQQQYRREPSGTNLLDATQADAMVRHIVEGLRFGDEAYKRAWDAYVEFSMDGDNKTFDCIKAAVDAALALPSTDQVRP